MFPDEQLYRNRSASQGQVGVVDSRGLPLGGVPPPPRGSPGQTRPWARLGLSLDTTLSVTSFSDSSGVEDDPGHAEALLEHVQHLATSILALNSATILNQHLPHGVGETVNVLLEVHYGDREELRPLEPPVAWQ